MWPNKLLKDYRLAKMVIKFKFNLQLELEVPWLTLELLFIYKGSYVAWSVCGATYWCLLCWLYPGTLFHAFFNSANPMGNTFCRMLTHNKIQWVLKGHYMILVLSYFQYPKETQISILTNIYLVQRKMQREAFDHNINQENLSIFLSVYGLNTGLPWRNHI